MNPETQAICGSYLVDSFTGYSAAWFDTSTWNWVWFDYSDYYFNLTPVSGNKVKIDVGAFFEAEGEYDAEAGTITFPAQYAYEGYTNYVFCKELWNGNTPILDWDTPVVATLNDGKLQFDDWTILQDYGTWYSHFSGVKLTANREATCTAILGEYNVNNFSGNESGLWTNTGDDVPFAFNGYTANLEQVEGETVKLTGLLKGLSGELVGTYDYANGTITFPTQKVYSDANGDYYFTEEAWGKTGPQFNPESTIVATFDSDGSFTFEGWTLLYAPTGSTSYTAFFSDVTATLAPYVSYNVSYDNGMTQWDKVYAYVWNGDNRNADWPGVEMTAPDADDDNITGSTVWSYEFETSWEPQYIIFNNGNGAQTEDLEFINEKEYGEAYKLLVYMPMNGAGLMTAAPFCADAAMAPQMGAQTFENGVFSWSVESWNNEFPFNMVVYNAAAENEYYFYGNPELLLLNNEWNQMVEFATPEEAYTTLPEAAQGQKVDFRYDVNNNKLWIEFGNQKYAVYLDNSRYAIDAPHAYAWNGEVNNSWPGVAMTQEENGLWKAEFNFVPTNVIFNNGGNGVQTPDLDFEENYVYGLNLYLAGAFNEWNAYDVDFELATEDDNVYTLTLNEELSGEWKVTAGGWIWNLGVADAADQPINTKVTSLAVGGANINTTVPAGAKLVINVEDKSVLILAPIYVVGDYTTTTGTGYGYQIYNHTWDKIANDCVVNPDEDGNYNIAMHLRHSQDAKFVLATNDVNPLTNYIGVRMLMAATDGMAMPFTYYTTENAADANVFSFVTTNDEDMDVEILLNPVEGKVYVNAQDVTTGINGIFNDADADAEYYTVQGVKVQNPVQGLYIRVANGKASKVIVK